MQIEDLSKTQETSCIYSVRASGQDKLCAIFPINQELLSLSKTFQKLSKNR